MLEDVQPGDYSLCVFVPPKADHNPGIDNVPAPIVGYVTNKDERVSFKVPANAGVDLGNVVVTSVLPFASGPRGHPPRTTQPRRDKDNDTEAPFFSK